MIRAMMLDGGSDVAWEVCTMGLPFYLDLVVESC